MAITKPEIGTTFHTGQASPVSGKFVCVKCEQAGKKHEIKVKEGEMFPECKDCKSAVDWRLTEYK
jgi:hypothetical protein